MIIAEQAYGDALARHFNLESAPSISTGRYKSAQAVATRISARSGQMRDTNTIPPENAFLLTVRLAPAHGVAIKRAGKLHDRLSLKAGAVGLFDLRDEIRKQVGGEYDAVQIYLPKILLPELVEAPTDGLELKPQIARDDEYLHGLARSLLPLFGVSGRAITIYFDQVASLMARHMLRHWAKCPPIDRSLGKGLTTWQIRRAKEMLAEALVGGPDLHTIAQACELTIERFMRGFREELGYAPHAWIRDYRAQKARDLVVTTSEPLVAIAYTCGFSDQSHMTRSFVRRFGISPGAMRRRGRST